MQRDTSEYIAIVQQQIAETRLADLRRILQHRLKDRLKLTGRRADDAQHLRGSRLLLKRFAQIIRALAQLVEQTRVLNGDDGLGGEILDQVDLLVGERPYFLTVNGDHTDRLIILEQGDAQDRPCAPELGYRFSRLFRQDVSNLD